jgi:transcriptional regulator with XRE-family HTH domain
VIGDEGRTAFLGDVGLRVRIARVGRRLSQDRLANLAGVSRVTLGSVERGEHDAGITTYRSLAMALDVPLPMLFGEVDGVARVGRREHSPAAGGGTGRETTVDRAAGALHDERSMGGTRGGDRGVE